MENSSEPSVGKIMSRKESEIVFGITAIKEYKIKEFCTTTEDCNIQTKSIKRSIKTKSTFTNIEPYFLPFTFLALRKYIPDKRKIALTKSERAPISKKRFDRKVTLSSLQRVEENEGALK